MSALLISVLALTAAPDRGQLPADSLANQSAPEAEVARKPHETRNAIRDTMRREAQTKDPAERERAIRELAKLLTEVRRDTQLTQDEQKRLHALLWSRLTRIKNELKAKMKREARAARRAGGPAGDDDVILAAPENQQLAAVVSQQFSLASQLTGGPGAVVVRSGEAFGGGSSPDHGEVLVELIESTIAPDTWESAGGHGSIYYFYPLQCLVIRQTGEIHGNAGDLLDGLRRAGP